MTEGVDRNPRHFPRKNTGRNPRISAKNVVLWYTKEKISVWCGAPSTALQKLLEEQNNGRLAEFDQVVGTLVTALVRQHIASYGRIGWVLSPPHYRDCNAVPNIDLESSPESDIYYLSASGLSMYSLAVRPSLREYHIKQTIEKHSLGTSDEAQVTKPLTVNVSFLHSL